MKKLIAIVLTLMLTLSLAACGVPTGTVEGQTYRNADMGFGITMDDAWTLEGQLEEDGETYDLYATNALTGESLNIIMASDDMDGKSEEAYLEQCAEEVAKEMENAGFSNVEIDIAYVRMAGRDCMGYNISCDMQGGTIYMTQAMWLEDGYAAVITSASDSTMGSRAIFKDFFPVSG